MRVFSTAEVNAELKKMGYGEVFSVNKVKSLGIEPIFETNGGTFWEKNTAQIIHNCITELNENKSRLDETSQCTEDLTMRDIFATSAMQSFLLGCNDIDDNYDEVGIAIQSYKMASAMMKARQYNYE